MKVLRLDTLDGRRSRGLGGRDERFRYYSRFADNPLFYARLFAAFDAAGDAGETGKLSDVQVAEIRNRLDGYRAMHQTIISEAPIDGSAEAWAQWTRRAEVFRSEVEAYVTAVERIVGVGSKRSGTRLAILGVGIAAVVGGLAAAVVYGERGMG